MMQHQFAHGMDVRATEAPAADAVCMLAYRSRATFNPSPKDIDRLLRAAQERNRASKLTGILIYEQGWFFQWLEGPSQSLMRVWDSIRRDDRHCDIEILREQPMTKRMFASWNLRLARRSPGKIESALAFVDAPEDLLEQLRVRPAVLSDHAWEQVLRTGVVPSLMNAHPIPLRTTPIGTAGIWHAAREAGAEFAAILLADTARTAQYVDGLIDEGALIEPLFSEVFEPAARCLGGMWNTDRCDEFSMTVAMSRLQSEARRLSAELSRKRYAMRPSHAILVATQPGETHGLNATMASELFWRGGWHVACEFPNTDDALRDLVHAQWFDVLELSSSGSLSRDQRFGAMRSSIQAALAASLNPALAVIVDGRSFFERPDAYLEVGATLASVSSIDALPAAERLMDSTVSRTSTATPTTSS